MSPKCDASRLDNVSTSGLGAQQNFEVDIFFTKSESIQAPAVNKYEQVHSTPQGNLGMSMIQT